MKQGRERTRAANATISLCELGPRRERKARPGTEHVWLLVVPVRPPKLNALNGFMIRKIAVKGSPSKRLELVFDGRCDNDVPGLIRMSVCSS